MVKARKKKVVHGKGNVVVTERLGMYLSIRCLNLEDLTDENLAREPEINYEEKDYQRNIRHPRYQ
jgi:hypothetical protein